MHAGTWFVLILAAKTFTFHDIRFLKAHNCHAARGRRVSLAKGVAFVSARRDEGHDGTPGI